MIPTVHQDLKNPRIQIKYYYVVCPSHGSVMQIRKIDAGWFIQKRLLGSSQKHSGRLDNKAWRNGSTKGGFSSRITEKACYSFVIVWWGWVMATHAGDSSLFCQHHWPCPLWALERGCSYELALLYQKHKCSCSITKKISLCHYFMTITGYQGKVQKAFSHGAVQDILAARESGKVSICHVQF